MSYQAVEYAVERMGMSVISVIVAVISVLGSLLVSFATSRHQIKVYERNKGSERKFEVYDKLMSLLSELNMDSAKSLNTAY